MGTLFVVATPIGNLDDLSFRALRTLREVDLIAAEDTRRTAKLLAHYEIRKPMVSLHAHNERREAPRFVERLVTGESIALVSDAGTPGISDPGAYLVSLARSRGVPVIPIPGPSAVMAALSASGLPADQFVFMGFPPRAGSDRQKWMKAVLDETRTTVAFEAPHRIRKTLTELTKLLVNRQINAYRELTKIHEELVIYTNERDTAAASERGEYVLVIAGNDSYVKSADDGQAASKAASMVGCLTINEAFDIDEAIKLASKAFSIEPANTKKAVKKARIEKNRDRERLS